MFTGDLERKTYADLNAFLAEGLSEGTRLDYKREMPDRIERTISAMANSEGGLIVIGVDEERATRTPKLPPDGIALAGQAERIQSKAYQAIHEPITALEFGTFLLPDGEHGVLVVRVHPSERAPHAVDQRRTVLRRVGAQAMKEGDDLDDRMDVDRMGWLFERRTRNQQLIDAAMARYESLLLNEPLPAGHYRFDIVAYPAVAHATPLTVRNLRAFTDLRGKRLFWSPWSSPPRTVSGGLVRIRVSPVSPFATPSYCDVTGLTAYTETHAPDTKMDEYNNTGDPVLFYPLRVEDQSLALLEWVGLSCKEAGRGGTIRVRARLQGIHNMRFLFDSRTVSDPSLQGEVTAIASASADDLASDPKPCVAELFSQLFEAFGREIAHDDMLKMIGG